MSIYDRPISDLKNAPLLELIGEVITALITVVVVAVAFAALLRGEWLMSLAYVVPLGFFHIVRSLNLIAKKLK